MINLVVSVGEDSLILVWDFLKPAEVLENHHWYDFELEFLEKEGKIPKRIITDTNPKEENKELCSIF